MGAPRSLGWWRSTTTPAPDAEDRLRRLFTILLRYAAEDAKRQPPTTPSPEDGGEEDGSCGPLIP